MNKNWRLSQDESRLFANNLDSFEHSVLRCTQNRSFDLICYLREGENAAIPVFFNIIIVAFAVSPTRRSRLNSVELVVC